MKTAASFAFSLALLVTSLLLAGSVCSGADLAQQVDELIPKLAADPVESRYEFQMQLQDLASQSSRPGAEAERAALASVLSDRVLRQDVPQAAKVWLLRQLEYMGGAEAVPALSTLLDGPDAELKECARRALEKSNAPAATASLRQALGRATDAAWQIGLLHALGEKEDPESVSQIQPFLKQPATANQAAWALGKIASREAVRALTEAWENNQPESAQALVLAARQLMERNNNRQARAILRNLFNPDQAVEVQTAAFSGLVQADPGRADNLVKDALQSQTPALPLAAIDAVRGGSKKLMAVLVKALPGLPASTQVLALEVVDASAEPTVQKLAVGSEASVRLAALEALQRVGTAKSVALLLHAAATRTGADQAAAQTALARLPGHAANQAILKAASQGDPQTRAVAIRALADRNQTDTLAQLLSFAAAAEQDVSASALSALRRMGSDAEVKPLADMVVETASAPAGAALKAVALRAENKALASQILAEAAGRAQGDALIVLLDVLPVLGGGRALDVVRAQLDSDTPAINTAAVRALSNWPDFAAVEPLLIVGSDPAADSTRQILAVRGLARLIKEASDQDPPRRVQLAQKAMAMAKRPEEKKIVISALGTVKHPSAIAEIQPLLADPDLRVEAAQAGLQLARDLAASHPEEAKALAAAIAEANISEDITRAARRLLR